MPTKTVRIPLVEAFDKNFGFIVDGFVDPTPERKAFMGRPSIEEFVDCGTFSGIVPGNATLDGTYAFTIYYGPNAAAPYTSKSVNYVAFSFHYTTAPGISEKALAIYDLTNNLVVGSLNAGTAPDAYFTGTKFARDVTNFEYIGGLLLSSGGTGYMVGDVVGLPGGTSLTGSGTFFTVTSVSGGGAITGLTPLTYAQYLVPPTFPVGLVGGTGTGATASGVDPTKTAASDGFLWQSTSASYSLGGTSSLPRRVIFNPLTGGVDLFPAMFTGYVYAGPTNAGDMTPSIIELGGYNWLLAKDGTLWNCNPGDSTNWNGLNRQQAFESQGTIPRALITHQGYLVGLGSDEVRFFQVTGAINNSAAAPVLNLSYGIGALSAGSADQSNEYMAFVGSTDGTGTPVYLFSPNSQVPQRISYPYLENLLGDFGGAAVVSAHFLTFRGHLCFCVRASDQFYVYDVVVGLWYQWNPFLMYTSSYNPVNAFALDYPSILNNFTFLGGFDANTKHFYVMQLGDASVDLPLNGGPVPYTAQITTKPQDGGVNFYKQWSIASLVGDQTPLSCPCGISYSDDGGRTFSTPKTVNMNSKYPVARNFGQARRRMWRVTCSGSNAALAALRLDALEMTLNLSAS